MNDEFKPGVELRDRNTGGRVRITAINPDHPRTGRARSGFTWVNLGGTRPGEHDHEGFCPASCAGGFEVIPPPTTWAQRNVPTFRAWWIRWERSGNAAQTAGPDTEAMQDFRREWMEHDWSSRDQIAQLEKQSAGDKILRDLALSYPPKISPAPVPTLEQQLAAVIAGGALGNIRATPGAMIYNDSVAADALELARQIISQSEN